MICDHAFDYPGAPGLARDVHAVAKEQGRVRTTNVTVPSLPYHYPTINLVHWLHRDEQVLSLGICQTAELDDFLAMGEILGQAIARSDQRVALLGTGGMSHRFFPLRALPDHMGYTPDDVISDERACGRPPHHRVVGAGRSRRGPRVLPRVPCPLARGALRALSDDRRRARWDGLARPRRALFGVRGIGGHRSGAHVVRAGGTRMSLQGWTLPQSDTGRSAILTPPPWHYSGEIISVDFTAAPDVVAALLPPGVEPAGDGSATFVFADWSSASDADPRIRDDPARGQYKEAYAVLYGTYDGKPVGRVPFIWVDNDLSLVRGLIQGFPKKLGQIAMTRPVEIGEGGVRKAIGSRFSAHVSSLGRRLATLSVTLEEEHEKLYPKGIATPLLHTRLWPAIDGDAPAVSELAGDDRGVPAGHGVLGPGNPGARRIRLRGARSPRADVRGHGVCPRRGLLGDRRLHDPAVSGRPSEGEVRP